MRYAPELVVLSVATIISMVVAIAAAFYLQVGAPSEQAPESEPAPVIQVRRLVSPRTFNNAYVYTDPKSGHRWLMIGSAYAGRLEPGEFPEEVK